MENIPSSRPTSQRLPLPAMPRNGPRLPPGFIPPRPPPMPPPGPIEFPALPINTYKFRLGWSIVHASGQPFSAILGDDRQIWHHVLHLQVRHGWFASSIRALARWLPTRIASHLRAWLPGPFLPPSIIVKQRKDGWEDEFANEIRRYEQLKSLQGTVVPVFFGTTTVDRTPAIVLSDVGGKQLATVSYSEYSREELEEKLRAALHPVYELGVYPEDANIANCHLVDGRIFIVDHEKDEDLEDEDLVGDDLEVESGDRLDDCVEGKVNWIMQNHWVFHKPKGASVLYRPVVIPPPEQA